MLNSVLVFARLAFLLSSMFLVNSCIMVGVGVVKEATETDKEFALKPEIGYIKSYHSLKYDREHGVKESSKNLLILSGKTTKQEVLNWWGNPNKIIQKNGVERLIYKRELGFSGVIIGVIIPVPLLLPVGYRNTEIVIEQDKVKGVIYREGDLTHFVGCGVSIMSGCRVSTRDTDYGSPKVWDRGDLLKYSD